MKILELYLRMNFYIYLELMIFMRKRNNSAIQNGFDGAFVNWWDNAVFCYEMLFDADLFAWV